jgi:hypothetical protein
MSYTYPVYEDKVNKTDVRFYHCSDKKSAVRVNKNSYAPGTILDADMSPLFQPTYSVAENATAQHTNKLKILDCTIVNLYYMDGEWYMGTKNSWNIRKLQDFVPVTYGEFFEECLSQYPDFSYDVLDKSKMYTVLFTNPRCHLLANECKVYVYSEQDELAQYFDILPEEKLFTDYILLDNKNTIVVHQSKIRELCMRLLYSNRRRLYSKDHNLALVKSLISAYCKCPVKDSSSVNEYLNDNLNSLCQDINSKVLQMFNHFEDNRVGSSTIMNVNVPAALTKPGVNPYNEKNIGFFVNLYRAYAN